MKQIYFLLLFSCSIALHAQYTAIPDPNFEARLASFDDIPNDGQVPTANIENFTGTLFLINRNISDLTGIEAFTSLTNLQVNGNLLTNLDISQNTALTVLNCHDNLLTSLDVTQNIALTQLTFNGNNIQSINLKQNSLLVIMAALNNPLLYCIEVANVTNANNGLGIYTNWEISSNVYYSSSCNDFYVSIPDVYFEIQLVNMGIDTNGINGVILNSDAVAVTTSLFFPNDAGITDFTGIEAFVNITGFAAVGNQTKRLDLSNSTNLTGNISVNGMGLLTLSVKNAPFNTVFISGNPNLRYVCVNDPSNPGAFPSIEMTSPLAVFTNNCLLTQQAYIPDDNFEQALINLGYDSGPLDDLVLLPNITAVTSLDISNNSISSLEGVDDFKALNTLNASNNNLTDITNVNLQSLLLTNLDCSINNISSPLATGNSGVKLPPTLIVLNLRGNIIPNITLPNSVETANLSHNSLTQFNISGLSALTDLDLSYNYTLATLNTPSSNSIPLENLIFNDCNISSLDTSYLTSLKSLVCQRNYITSLDLSTATGLIELIAYDNRLIELNIKNGNNSNIGTSNFDVLFNYGLDSICVDNVAYANTVFYNNVDPNIVFTDDCSNNTLIQVSPKVYLQGAYTNPNTGEETLMRNDLSLYIPIVSPYEDALAYEAGLPGNNATVDWVWVELRSSTDDSLVFGRSALLQRNGDIFDARTGGALRLMAPNEDDYYVVIKHRNHLNIKTSNTISLLSSPTTSIDFTSNSNSVFGGLNSVVNINGIYAMYAGDFDGNGQIQNTDANSVVLLLGTSGYNDADLDMNGQIQNTDINIIINPNIGRGEQF